jgi:hypothetical protein
MLILTLKCHGKIAPTKVGDCAQTSGRDFSRTVPCHDTLVSDGLWLICGGDEKGSASR